jgi:NADH-quinone oxidoreductase subunit N
LQLQPGTHNYLDQLSATVSAYYPQITLCVFIIALVACAFYKSTGSLPKYLAIAAVIASTFVGFLNGVSMDFDSTSGTGTAVFALPRSFSLLLNLATLLTLLITRAPQKTEYFILILSVLLGAQLLIVSDHFVMIVLGMEILSLSSYVLVAGTVADKRRAEAAWKFFIYGSTATAIMIFGMSYLYGGTNSLILGETGAPTAPNSLMTIGGLMVLTGFLFKTTAAPLHLWAPDVYEATPSPIVAFLSVVPKIAGIALILKLTFVQVLRIGGVHWSMAISIAAVLSIAVGTLSALAQKDVKRMMAYSSVAQAGFLLLITLTSEGIFELLNFYLLVFTVMNYVVFVVINIYEQRKQSLQFSDFSGLGYTDILPSIAITIGLISLVGLPPVAGFMAKLGVFVALFYAYDTTQLPQFLIAFLIGLLATVASLFFYLKIPFYLYFRRSTENQPLKTGLFTNLLLLILVSILVALFFAPGVLMGR